MTDSDVHSTDKTFLKLNLACKSDTPAKHNVEEDMYTELLPEPHSSSVSERSLAEEEVLYENVMIIRPIPTKITDTATPNDLLATRRYDENFNSVETPLNSNLILPDTGDCTSISPATPQCNSSRDDFSKPDNNTERVRARSKKRIISVQRTSEALEALGKNKDSTQATSKQEHI